MDEPSLAGRRVLVTGATGAVGQPVTQALAHAGAHVHVLLRQPADVPGMSSIEIGDITDPRALERAVAGCDAVVHLAALLHITNPPASLEAEYQRVNDAATANLVARCTAHGVSRVVLASTISVYGPLGGEAPLNEQSPCRPDTPYGRTKLAAEAHVRASRRADGRPLGVVLRLAAVYGPGVKGNYRRLLEALARGRYVQVGAGRNRRVLVHVSDVAQAVLLALTHPDAPGGTFNVTDGTTHEVREIVAAMCEALGRPVPRLRVPLPVARAGVSALAAAARLTGRPAPVTRAALDKLVEDVAVDGRLLQQRLGFVPRMSLTAGWRDVVAGAGQDLAPSRTGD